MATNHISVFIKKANAIASILVGDELGQVKRIDIPDGEGERPVVRTVNKRIIRDLLSPDQSVLSIRPFPFLPEVEFDDDDPDADSRSIRQALSRGVFVVIQRVSKMDESTKETERIFLYNSNSDETIPIISPPSLNNSSPLVGASPVTSTDIVLIYEDGGVYLINVESELCRSSGQNPDKALKILGIEAHPPPMKKKDSSSDDDKLPVTDVKESATSGIAVEGIPGTSADAVPRPIARGEPPLKKKKVKKDLPPPPFNPVVTVADPKWKKGDKAVTCFSVDSKRLAIAGRNLDPMVFDSCTKQCIFTAKSGATGKHQVSDITWIGPISKEKSTPSNPLPCKVLPSPVPCLLATCCRTDPVVRIYDIRLRQHKKPVWMLNLKDATFANDTNPPSFTCITSSPSPTTCAVPNQQLILGTTMGRMMALELRFNSHSFRPLGIFKGFSGGTVRDVSFVPNVGRTGDHKVISCSLDRFVRIHSFRLGSAAQRKLESKFYIKTRPTCVQPILSSILKGKPVSKEDSDYAVKNCGDDIEPDLHVGGEGDEDDHPDLDDDLGGDGPDDEDGDSDINVTDFDEP